MVRENVYNKFRSTALWDKVPDHNKELIADYGSEMKIRGRSPGTIKQYTNDLKIFASYVVEKHGESEFYKLSRKDIKRFVTNIQDKGMSPARINRILCAIRTMYEYASDEEDYEELYKENVASKIKGVDKESVREIHFLSRKQVDFLFETLLERKLYQQALLLALLMDSAGRRNEIYQIDKTSITEDGCFTNQVLGKGKKKFKLMYNEMTKRAYKYYIEERGEDNYEFLWYKVRFGKKSPVASNVLYNWVKSWNNIISAEFGIECDFNIHSFRHTALELLSTGEHYLCELLGVKFFPLESLQALAHHNDISTTNSYLKDKTEDILINTFTKRKED